MSSIFATCPLVLTNKKRKKLHFAHLLSLSPLFVMWKAERHGFVLDVDLKRLELGKPASTWGSEAYDFVPKYCTERDTPPALFKVIHDLKVLCQGNPFKTGPRLSDHIQLSTLEQESGVSGAVLGKTPVVRVWLGEPGTEKSKRQPRHKILITCGMHAREWYSQEVVLLLITHLTALAISLVNPATRPLVGWWARANVEFVIVPVVNLFGYLFTLMGPGKAVSWGKSKRNLDAEVAELKATWQYSIGSKALTGKHVCRANRKPLPLEPDINRNFTVFFGDTTGSSDCPLDDDYHGTGPASEPETKAIIALMKHFKPDLVVDVHSYGDDVLEPGGMDPKRLNGSKPSVITSRWLAQEANAILLGKPDTVGTKQLYPCSGAFEDEVLFNTDSAMLTLELGYGSFSADHLQGQQNKMALPGRLMNLFQLFCEQTPPS